ncbi:MAG: hypothetical protein R6W90_04020 [Ignavibacteriaceae bacterium]
MSLLSDDMLNKYLDGDLDNETRRKISNQIEFSEEDRRRYLELQAVHSGLGKMKLMEVSSEFTSLLMSRLLKVNKAKKEQRIFITSIVLIFIAATMVIIGFALSFLISSLDETAFSPVINEFVSLLSSPVNSIVKNLNNQSLSIIGSVISFGLIISAYFFFESFKHSRESLNKF